jgi:hypothetical protein
MRYGIKLLYIGMLKYGFNNGGQVNITGLIDYVLKQKLELDDAPTMDVNHNYVVGGDEWFWELEWRHQSRCLVVYFDKCGCHFQRLYDEENIAGKNEGLINKYEDFLEHFMWLSGL